MKHLRLNRLSAIGLVMIVIGMVAASDTGVLHAQAVTKEAAPGAQPVHTVLDEALRLGGRSKEVISVLVREGLVKCLNRRDTLYYQESPLRPADIVMVGPEAEAVWAYAKAHPSELMTAAKLAELAPETGKPTRAAVSVQAAPAQPAVAPKLELVPPSKAWPMVPVEPPVVRSTKAESAETQSLPAKLIYWGIRVGPVVLAVWIMTFLWFWKKKPGAV